MKAISTNWKNIKEAIHIGLDVAGQVPGIGEFADGANALFYLGEGDLMNAGISAASMIPIVGAAASGTRLGYKAAKLWSSTKKMSSVENAFGHWKKHGSEFPEFLNAKQYVEGVRGFMNSSPAGTLTKTRANGDILKYHPKSNTFGVMDANGIPKTMFKPADGMKYWINQK
jgi:hypothetical protein